MTFWRRKHRDSWLKSGETPVITGVTLTYEGLFDLLGIILIVPERTRSGTDRGVQGSEEKEGR